MSKSSCRRYMRQEQQSLMAVSREAIFESRVEWGPLPNFKGAGSGSSSNTGSAKSERGERNKQTTDKTATEKPKGNCHFSCLRCAIAL